MLHYGDLTDSSNLTRIVQEVQPDEVYNLGATGRQHSVRDFVRMSAQHLGVTLRFQGKGLDEVGMVERDEGAGKARLDTPHHAGGAMRGDGRRGSEPRQTLRPAAAVRVYDADAEGVRV